MIRTYTVDLSSTTAYPAEAQVTAPFTSRATAVTSNHPTAIIYASIDGELDAATINSARVAGVQWGTPTRQVWLKRAEGDVSPEEVTVDVTVEDTIY